MAIQNPKVQAYPFLEIMSRDRYYPAHLVERGQQLLIQLCEQIEQTRPEDLDALYRLTHATTEAFNALGEDFYAEDSELETVARDCIAVDFSNIAQAYGFDADIEELVAPREW
jgi:hypothetical protein